MEKEAVAGIARMFGWDADSTSATSAAAARWRTSRRCGSPGGSHPGKAVLASSQAHYTHGRIGGVLGLPFEAVACDAPRAHGRGRARAAARAGRRRHGRRDDGHDGDGIGRSAARDPGARASVTASACTPTRRTAATSASRTTSATPARRAFDRVGEADSIVIDPHKHGLQPYGCGCVLFRDPAVGRLYKHDSPYTYFSSTELHLGEISLECSRPGGERGGALGDDAPAAAREGRRVRADGCPTSRQAALALHAKLAADARFLPAFAPELDIVVWAVRAASAGAASARARARLRRGGAPRPAPRARGAARRASSTSRAPGSSATARRVTCLRSVLMKPEHREWLDRIWTHPGRRGGGRRDERAERERRSSVRPCPATARSRSRP